MDKFTPLHVILMQNTLQEVENANLKYIFDMKGSTIKREVLKQVNNQDFLKAAERGVLKDLDFIRLNEMKNFFNMDNKTLQLIHHQISLDVQYLQSQRFMDYSLLFSVRKVNKDKVETIDFNINKIESDFRPV